MRHSIDGFIDGAVAARDQNQIRPAIHGASRNLAGMPRTRGRNRIDSDAERVEPLNRSLERMLAPPEPARVRIINENGLPVGRDSTLIIVNGRA